MAGRRRRLALLSRRAEHLARELESSVDLAPPLAGLWLFHTARGQFSRAEEITKELFQVADTLHDPDILLQAHHCGWTTCWFSGALASAKAHADAGIGLYDEVRHARHRFLYLGHDPAVCALSIRSVLQWALGQPTQGLQSLALLYVIASVRAGHWLIPAFHAAIDGHIPNGHDDPLNFDIDSFAAALERVMARVYDQQAELKNGSVGCSAHLGCAPEVLRPVTSGTSVAAKQPIEPQEVKSSYVPHWGVWLAADLSESGAWALYRERLRRFASLIGDRKPVVLFRPLPAMGKAKRYIIAIVDDDRAPLDKFCKKLTAAGNTCNVMRNEF